MNPWRVAVGCLVSILGLAAFQAPPSSPAKPAEEDEIPQHVHHRDQDS